MRRLVLIFGFLFNSALVVSANYPVSAIPEDMKQNRYAVIREASSVVNIVARNKSIEYERLVITILKPTGRQLAVQYIPYDRLRKITSVKAMVYNENGDLVKKIKSAEIQDQSAYDGFSLYSDNRMKKIDMTQSSYPYTIELEYEIEVKFLYSLPTWYLYIDDEVSIQKSEYKISYPAGTTLQYKLNNIQEPKKTNDGSTESLYWSFENIKPERWERMSPAMKKIVPNIMAAPTEFEYEGYSGKMDTWKNFGVWQNLLNKDRDILPETTRAKVKTLIQEAKSDEEKIKILYEYLQGKTRYVSIQTGIGGLQPFEATIVDKVGYGDCKALSIYMISLLKEAGLKGYYTKIMAGENAPDIDITFPSHQTNHIIVAAPIKNDTIWLECTSQNNPFGYLGTFTSDRYAIMVTETGGVVVRTPSYPDDINVQSRTAHVTLERTGDATAKAKTTYSGLQYDEAHLGYYANLGYEDQKKWIRENTAIPSFDINSFSIQTLKEKIPSVVVDQDLTLRKFASVSGKRLFITPNLMNRSVFIPEKLEQRKTSVIQRHGFVKLDTIKYTIPEGLHPEFAPQPTKISSPFGEYEASVNIRNGKVIYIRKLKIVKGEFPPESYGQFVEFYKSINKADHIKLVFLSET